jgi:hypothetical protein
MRRPVRIVSAAMLASTLALVISTPSFAQAVLNPPPLITSPTYLDDPPPQQEIITAAPSPSYVWVPGQWGRTADSWSWQSGTWVQPPFSNAYWTPGYWRNSGGQYVWQGGHWAAADQGVVVNKPITVPATYVETQPATPVGTGWVWQPGYWTWRGTWVWVPGEYIQSVVPTAVWKPGSWQAAPGGTWRWNPAHWSTS